MGEYGDKEIEVLEGLDSVRVRPKLWIGGTDSAALHRLLWEQIYNCLDEYNAGYCSRIVVSLNADGSITVEDNGRGLPTDVVEKTGLTGVETVFTTLGCPTGFQMAMVNALSEWLEVEVFWQGKQHRLRYERGRAAGPQQLIGDTSKTGTRISLLPDKEIFVECGEHWGFDWETLYTRLREFAFLNKGLCIELIDAESSKREAFSFDDGICNYLGWINENHTKVNQAPFFFSGAGEIEKDRVNIECVLQWTDRKDDLSLVFFNSDPANEEFRMRISNADLARVLSQCAREIQILKAGDADISDAELSKGLSSVLSIKGDIMLRCLDKEYLRKILDAIVADCFAQHLRQNVDFCRELVEIVCRNRQQAN